MKNYVTAKELNSDAVCNAIASEKTEMSMETFMENCMACGGNLTGMLFTGMKKLFPRTFEALPESTFEFDDILSVLDRLGVQVAD